MVSRSTSEPGRLPAGVLAILVHVAFFMLLVFGVTWRTQTPAPVMVDLWTNVPQPTKQAPVEPPEPPKQEAVTPKPAPQPVPKPQPLPKPKAEPQPMPKPDIALKEKEAKKKLEEEKLRKEEAHKKEEALKREEALKKEIEKKQAEERKKVEERERQDKLKEEQAKKLAAQREALAKAKAEEAIRAAGDARVNDFITKIQAKIRSNMEDVPADVKGNPQVTYEITLLPTGEVLNVRLVKGSGFASYDAAAERAIRRSAPLPIPKDDPALFASKFRVGNYSFRPND